mmetsp:Transcript_16117/g.44607  ORF Transcript_16117/g.44607 Transcript_16117/m.44607 type:complete len:924 (-) Transcript_16117:1257-4028(-)
MGKSSAKRKSQKTPSKPSSSSQPEIHNSKSFRPNSNDDVLLPQEFPARLPQPPKGDFLRDEHPYRESFEAAIRGPYEGFVVDDAQTLSSLSSTTEGRDCRVNEQVIQTSLENMARDGFFRTDVTQPFGLGTKCAKTYVTRCVVGAHGTTYKYLGLRMFAHPWTAGGSNDYPNRAGSNRANKRRKRNSCDGKDKTNNPDQSRIGTQQQDGVHHQHRHHQHQHHHDTPTIQKLGQAMTNRTLSHLRDLDERRRQRRVSATRGRSNFDICLINRMESSSDLKPYVFGGDNKRANANNNKNKSTDDSMNTKTSVSWHADSSLEHYSTIAVYQTLLLGGSKTSHNDNDKIKDKIKVRIKDNDEDNDKAGEKRTNQGKTQDSKGQWWVALRVAEHAEGPQASQRRRGTSTETSIVEETSPVAVSLPSGSAYYLLDDFNHHHQHTVLTTGDAATAGVRYSCTFRLLRDSHNVRDWIERGNAAMRQFHKKGPKLWRSEQLLLTEIESEWIRQFYIQGTGHHKLLWESYWKTPMTELLSIWSQLEVRTKQTMDLLRAAAEGKCGLNETVRDGKSGKTNVETKPTKAERKARDRGKKALGIIQEIVSRINIPEDSTREELFEPFAKLLEDRAKMRELWRKRERDHVFHEMPPDCRPMEVPFRFEVESAVSDSSSTLHNGVGKSPLPESPVKLKEMARDVLQCGEAYREGSADLLPPPWRLEKLEKNLMNGNDSDQHAKPMDWAGWAESGNIFALELQQPWAGAIVDGKKLIETRSYTLPPSLIGKKIMILESATGQAGISCLGNHLSLIGHKGDGMNIIGWCIFSSVKIYTTGEEFRNEENLHLVSSDSGYGWKDGETKKVYGWIVEEYHRHKESSSDAGKMFSGMRRFRSLFQLDIFPEANCNERKSKNKNKKKSHHAGKNQRSGKKKRKRY